MADMTDVHHESQSTTNAAANATNPTPRRPQPGEPVRFGVVAVGQISQQAFLPAMRSLPDAKLTAVVTSSEEKAGVADDLAGTGHDPEVYGYEDFGRLLADDVVDALYVATPVFRHREFTEPALDAGIHVLLEKPMATSVADSEAMIAAAQRSGATLMVAYRMHQDAFMVELVDRVRRGFIGETRTFTSTFTHDIEEANHRGHSGFWGGPVPDFGAYPLNLVRHLFGAEPTHVHATGAVSGERGFNFHDVVGVTLRFPGNRVAQYTLSYNSADLDAFAITGTKGTITSDSVFGYAPEPPREFTLDSDLRSEHYVAESVDQFAGETRYFIDCLRSGVRPEPDGAEGLADVRVFAAIEESLRLGREVILPPRQFGPGLTRDQIRRIPPRPSGDIPGDDDLVDQVPQDR